MGDGDRRHIFHGRRAGRTLRIARRAALEDGLPATALDLPAPGAALDPRALFPGRPVWLEIGFGNGEHLIGQAALHPDVGFIGCEPFVNGVSAFLRHLPPADHGRVRVLMDDARPLLEALTPASIGRMFLLFSDPWPKARHHRRRVIQDQSLNQFARILEPGAELRVATDDPSLLDWTLEHLARHPDFTEATVDRAIRPADWPPTRYEQKAIAAGRHPSYMIWRRRA